MRNPAMFKSVISFLVVAALLAAAVVLNPSAEDHRSKIKAVIGERSQLEKVLGVGPLTAFASRYHSVWIGSYTTLDEKVVSIGAFGGVVVSDRS